MPVGLVKWFDAKKGFGFLIGPTGEDIFVHFTVIDGEGFRRLRDGEQVNYECVRGPKGFLATKVQRVAADVDGQTPGILPLDSEEGPRTEPF